VKTGSAEGRNTERTLQSFEFAATEREIYCFENYPALLCKHAFLLSLDRSNLVSPQRPDKSILSTSVLLQL
jgi:hypothetical protein